MENENWKMTNGKSCYFLTAGTKARGQSGIPVLQEGQRGYPGWPFFMSEVDDEQ
jgi:hypothetical protein